MSEQKPSDEQPKAMTYDEALQVLFKSNDEFRGVLLELIQRVEASEQAIVKLATHLPDSQSRIITP